MRNQRGNGYSQLPLSTISSISSISRVPGYRKSHATLHCLMVSQMTDHQRKIEHHQQANRECAELILKDAPRYGGEGAGLVMWARMVWTAA